jgi:hypothetical protein
MKGASQNRPLIKKETPQNAKSSEKRLPMKKYAPLKVKGFHKKDIQ